MWTLHQWNKTSYGSVQSLLVKANLQLKRIQNWSRTEINQQEVVSARQNVQVWLEREELLWTERSQV